MLYRSFAGGKTIKIGYLSTIYHTSFLLKKDPYPKFKEPENKLKYYNTNLNDYNLEWNLFATGPAMLDAFAKKEIELGYIGLPPVMVGINNGINIKCVGGGHIEGTVMVSKPHYKSLNETKNINQVLQQFKGEKIGVPTKGCIHDVIIRRLTEKHNISIKNYPWADFIPSALEDGEIVAGVGTPALATAVFNQLKSKIIISPDKLWPYNPSYGIVVRDEIINESPEFILDFLKAHENACNFIREKRDLAARIVSNKMGVINKEFALKTYNISPRYCASIPPEYIESTLKFVVVLKKLGYINKILGQDEIFNLEFI